MKKVRCQKGASLVEYGMLVALMSVALIGGLTATPQGIAKGFCRAIAGMDRNSAPYFVAAANGQPARCLQHASFGAAAYF